MFKFESRNIWGFALIAFGVLFLLQELSIIESVSGIIWALILFFAGSLFLYAYSRNRVQWWALIPGFTLVSVGIGIILGDYFSGWLIDITGMVILGGIGISFLMIYLLHREMWWAIIPAGVMITLAVIAGLDDLLRDSGSIFFLGMGTTFLLVALLPTNQGRMTWAFIPAGVLYGIGLIAMSFFSNVANFIWPILLIVGGGYIILRNFRS